MLSDAACFWPILLIMLVGSAVIDWMWQDKKVGWSSSGAASPADVEKISQGQRKTAPRDFARLVSLLIFVAVLLVILTSN